MKNLTHKILFVALLLAAGALSVFGQKDILLYETDFTNWAALASSGSNSDMQVLTDGFKGNYKPEVNPTGTIAGQTGYFKTGSNASNAGPLFSPPFKFVSGGVVVLEVVMNGTSTGRKVAVTVDGSATGITATVVSNPAMGSTNYSVSGNTVDLGKPAAAANGVFVLSFNLPATLTGMHTIEIVESNSDTYLTKLSIYSGVGTNPYVASTNYSEAPATGHTMKGAVGGAAGSGTAVNALVNAKLWNSANDVVLSIEGTDAAKFAIDGADTDGKLTVSNATAKAAFNVPIKFTPSVVAGVAKALLKIEAAGCQPYYVTLTGLSGGATPQILASDAEIPFWGGPISKTTKTLNVAGLNLTGDVTVSITGAGASKFSVSPMSIPMTTATNGTSIDISYTADIAYPATDNATLCLNSQSATPVCIPLVGYTLESKPALLELAIKVSPSGSGFVNVNPAGPMYIKGTEVKATVTPETGWEISYWGDAQGNRAATRTFKVSELKQGTITVYLIKSDNGGGCLTCGGSFVIFHPDESKGEIKTDGFVLNWSKPADDATNPVTNYEVIIYNKLGTQIGSPVSVGGTSNSYTVSGLTDGEFYYYEIKATKTDSTTETTPKGGPVQVPKTPTSVTCGN